MGAVMMYEKALKKVSGESLAVTPHQQSIATGAHLASQMVWSRHLEACTMAFEKH